MQYTLADLLWAFVLAALSMSLFGAWGLAVAAILLASIVWIRRAKSGYAALARGAWAPIICSPLFMVLLSASVKLAEDRDAMCRNNLQQVGVALDVGDPKKLRYPIRGVAVSDVSEPAKCMTRFVPSVDATDKPVVSWRVALLGPWQQGSLYERYNLSERWNGPNNIALVKNMPRELGCPDDPKSRLWGTTSYAAVAGPNGNWLNSGPLAAELGKRDYRSPVLVVEVPGGEIVWTEPRDLTMDEACRVLRRPPDSAGRHIPKSFFWEYQEQGGPYALFADGMIRHIPAGVPEALLRAALLGDRQKQAELDEFRHSISGRPRWSNLFGLMLLIACVVAMLTRPRRLRVGPATVRSRVTIG